VRTTHVWDGAHMAAELNASGVAVIRFTRGRGGRLIHSQHHGWYLHNARGDVVQRVNGTGAAWRTYRYTAFGVELNPVANPNPFRFAGEYYDAETGRIYLRARFYDPRLGRFTQPDPFWGVGNMRFGSSPLTRNGRLVPSSHAIMQAGNLFVYTVNNPVMFVDPSGQIAILAPLVPAIIKAAPKIIPTIVTAVTRAVTAPVVAPPPTTTAPTTTRPTVAPAPTTTAPTTRQITADLGEIARKHGIGQCVQAAREMADVITKSGQQPYFAEFVFTGALDDGTVRTVSGGRFAPNTEISWSGYHVGMLFNDRIFCNVHPLGLQLENWFRDFVGSGTQIRRISTVPLDPFEMIMRYAR